MGMEDQNTAFSHAARMRRLYDRIVIFCPGKTSQLRCWFHYKILSGITITTERIYIIRNMETFTYSNTLPRYSFDVYK